MRSISITNFVRTIILLTAVLLFAAGMAVAQQQINLSAGPATTVLPDGTVVPMWGYTCGAAVAGSAATCAALNTNAPIATWSPVVITIPTGQTLQINLTNNLMFPTTGTPTSVATSLVIVGQLGGGLGDSKQRTTAPSPDHSNAQTATTWPIAGGPGTTPPTQGQRVQSFGTEVAATGAAVVGNQCASGCALSWAALRPGTYLLESGTHPSIQGPMGLYGMVVVTDAPSATPVAPATTTTGCAYSAAAATTCVVPYNAEAELLFSEIDPVQNKSVDTAVRTANFSETMVWSGQPGGCGNSGSSTNNQCYPPAVNYKPLYYLINGVAFDKTHAQYSVFSSAPTSGITAGTGQVLLRLVNAGLRMHVPSVVGSLTATPATAGISLIAEDGNQLPGIPRLQSEVFMAAGKTYDVMINAPTSTMALPIFDRELSLSGNATARDAGMLAYIAVNNGTLPSAPELTVKAQAVNDDYPSLISGQAFTVSDPGKGVIANDVGVFGVQLLAQAVNGIVTLNADGTFTYVPGGTGTTDSFTYCANGSVTGTTCSSGITATVNLSALATASVTCTSPVTYNSATVASYFTVKTPGLLANCTDSLGYKLTVVPNSISAAGMTVVADANGGFTAIPPARATGTATLSFTYQVRDTAGGTATGEAIVQFPTPSNLSVTVKDPTTGQLITDYRWIIEEDRTFYINPNCTTNPPPAGCPVAAAGIVPTFGTNFHTSYMPVIAAGCWGGPGTTPTTPLLACENGQSVLGTPAHCDVGNGLCATDAAQQTPLDPGQVHLDPTKHYYISILPGDAANPFNTANAKSGHGMGGAQLACNPSGANLACTSSDTFPAVTVLVEPNPFQPAKLSVFVFEDDFPLNGEQDGGGGIDVLSPNEPGLGGFEITLFDDAGGTGDATGQLTHDMFNQPLSNSLAGMIDPVTGADACPLTPHPFVGVDSTNGNALNSVGTLGITGRIVTCPKFEGDGKTLSPLAGQAVIANMMPGRYGVVATPAADRIARGEEWLQTNTLDGQKAHDSFLRIAEPGYFQEYGPAGYHVSIGFANPAIINSRLPGICSGADPNSPQPGTPYTCNHTVTGMVTTERMSRTPDERLYGSNTNDSFAFTQCYVSFGDPDGEDFAFTKCNSDGTFTLAGLPDGDWRITIFDQWNDMLVDGLSTPVRISSPTTNLGQLATSQWQANIYTTTFFDGNGNGVRDNGESGLTLVSTNIRFRDGSYSNFNNTDLNGNAGFNEVFPLFSWYVIETDSTRYKTTGVHVVYDAGGPSDGTSGCGGTGTGAPPPCGNSTIAANFANTYEAIPVPTNLHVPGAYYCSTADCADAPSPLAPGGGTPNSTGRVDPPMPWGTTEGWQGFSGQNNFIEFGKKPFAVGENGGIHGEVNYASTRPFDDPQLNLHDSWTPDVPDVTVNLYQEGVAADGVTPTLKLVDHTITTSWDRWAQGFRSDNIPNMNCPGQGASTGTNADLFFFSLYNQPNYLDFYSSQHGGPAYTPLPNNSQFKCYDGMHNWNQIQPAPYDGMYSFPSITGISPTTGLPTGTNCTICLTNPDVSDPYRYGGSSTPVAWTPGHGAPMLPVAKYVVEVVVPPGYELYKEEDKNILIGDNYIAPVTQQFGALADIFIMPDQAAVGASYNAYNSENPTSDLGTLHLPRGEGDTGSVEQFWPCVGETRIVPDYISLFPGSLEVAPFAGATRNLCDRKEITLQDQESALAKFYIFSSTHVAAHYTGVITDDYTSEFDPFSPQFGEKFSPPNLPISIKDFNGNEVSRTYADHWGTYDGLNYSTWEVNPPNPTGYAPTMMVVCMNDPGPILDTRQIVNSVANPTLGQMITDPLFSTGYSQFCYEIPFMPGQTQYMDTPVVPTSAFAGAGYNNVDCSYPDATPAVKEVDGDGIGPWLSATGALKLTITALGDQVVPNYAYSGPSAPTAPFNQKTITRHYGFGPAPVGGCSNGNASAACPNVTVAGVPLHGVTWTDSQITGTVQATAIPPCPMQQQAIYGGSAAKCGELAITATNGKSSIDTVTVTIGGKAPTHVGASGSIQSAMDAAAPGDLIIVDPTCVPTTAGAAGVDPCSVPGSRSTAAHNEILIMWKPVRLQGVGAASSVINANTHPAGKLDVWRAQVNCLFGLALNGQPYGANNPFDPQGKFSCPGTGWKYFNPTTNNPQVDRLPLEATLGWDANLNGNLAELLQEPSLMGALEGAGITVLSKGVFFASNPFDPTLLAGFPTGTVLFEGPGIVNNTATYCAGTYPSNFTCNPSSVDGLGITDSSQGGGGIFVHAWGHNIQIANNRITSNAGTLSGGINIGQGEFPGAYIAGSATNAAPGSCNLDANGVPLVLVANQQQPYCHNMRVNVHNNDISLNSSTGDELFSATPAGAGGVSFCTGSDYYKFNNNWVCGNMSSGDGGGFGHLGFSYNADIEHNNFLFNQSINPTIPANGGGLIIMGTPDVDPTCGTTTDQDCVPPLGTVGPSDGIGPGLVINANLIQGNSAESGSGGGVALQHINGSEVVTFPTDPTKWYSVQFTNNIVVDNVAGWDGGGISLLDALNMNIVNNTIMSNSTTASSGILFNTLGAPLASTQGSSCIQANGTATDSCPQISGLVSQPNSAVLTASLPLATVPTVNCPAGHASGTLANGDCRAISYPLLSNNIFWQNSAGYIHVGALGAGTLNQQHVVTLLNAFTGTLVANQTGSGQCTTDRTFWDLGVRGDAGPTDHGSGHTLNPQFSILTPGSTGYNATNNRTTDPTVVSQYCDGSRTPPEFGASGWQVPPGISDATVPNPLFNLTPVATVDEGNNWVNMRWGPLSTVNPVTNVTLGNYSILAGSPAINNGTATHAPSTDFFGTTRPQGSGFDIGAVEFVAGGGGGGSTSASVSPTALNFGELTRGTTSLAMTVTVTNTGTTALAGGTFTFGGGTPQPFARATALQGGPGTCSATLAVGVSCTVNVVFSPAVTAANGTAFSRTLTVAYTGATVTGSPVTLTGTALARGSGALTFSAASNGTLATLLGVRTLTFTIPTPRAPVTSVVTVTNSGTGPLQITAESLPINVGGLYSITGTTCSFTTPLAAGGTCTVSLGYAAAATRPTFPDVGAFGAPNNGAAGTNVTGTLALVAQ